MQYVGESERSLKERFNERTQRLCVTNRHLSKSAGYNFNLPGHKVADMRVAIIKKVHSSDSSDPFLGQKTERGAVYPETQHQV